MQVALNFNILLLLVPIACQVLEFWTEEVEKSRKLREKRRELK